jgi:hypothetical protein
MFFARCKYSATNWLLMIVTVFHKALSFALCAFRLKLYKDPAKNRRVLIA